MKAASDANKTEMGRWEDIDGDDPISRADQDELDRETTCRTLADICERIDASEGRTVGLIGPWGCGKTSCLRVTRSMLEERDVRVIEFNPWLWSEAGDLVQGILDAIARTCGGVAELESIAGKLTRYARQLAGVNPWADAAGRLVKEWSVRMCQSGSPGAPAASRSKSSARCAMPSSCPSRLSTPPAHG